MTKIKNLVDIVINESELEIQTKINDVWVLYQINLDKFCEFLIGNAYIDKASPCNTKVLENGAHEFLYLGLYLETNGDLIIDYLKENGVEII